MAGVIEGLQGLLSRADWSVNSVFVIDPNHRLNTACKHTINEHLHDFFRGYKSFRNYIYNSIERQREFLAIYEQRCLEEEVSKSSRKLPSFDAGRWSNNYNILDACSFFEKDLFIYAENNGAATFGHGVFLESFDFILGMIFFRPLLLINQKLNALLQKKDKTFSDVLRSVSKWQANLEIFEQRIEEFGLKIEERLSVPPSFVSRTRRNRRNAPADLSGYLQNILDEYRAEVLALVNIDSRLVKGKVF